VADVDPLDVALAGCLSRTAALRKRVGEYERRYRDRTELPGTLLLLRALLVILNGAEEWLLETHAQEAGEDHTARERARREVAATVKTYERIVGDCLNGVSTMHSRDFDPFVRPFSRLARLVDLNTEIIFQPLAHYTSYEITRPVNTNIKAQLLDANSSLREQVDQLPTIVYLNYPASEELDCLHHLLMGHELGHLALRRSLPNHRGEIGDALPRGAMDRYKAQQRELPEERDRAPETARDLEILQTRVTNWFTELACDRLGVKLVGPGYFLALFEHAALTQWFYREPPPDGGYGDRELSTYDRHPAMAWRVGRLWQLVQEYLPPAGSELPGARETRRVLHAFREAIPSWDEMERSKEALIIENAMEEYVKVEHELLGEDGAEYKPASFLADLPLVWSKLDKDIAPAERIHARRDQPGPPPPPWRPALPNRDPMPWSAPVEWRSILNGGFLHWLNRERRRAYGFDRSGWERRRRDRVRACALLRGSVELSDSSRRQPPSLAPTPPRSRRAGRRRRRSAPSVGAARARGRLPYALPVRAARPQERLRACADERGLVGRANPGRRQL
jgi:hypothetical protein